MKRPEDKGDKQPLTRTDVQTIIEIGAYRKALLERLRTAILAGDTLLQHELTRELTGLPKETTQ